MQARAALCLAVAITAAASRLCLAAGGALRLTWTAPTSCPDRTAVVDRVTHLVGRTPQTEEDAWFEADVTATDAGRWRAVVRSGWAGSATERRFESASCTSIASATALIIAMSIDPAGVADRASVDTTRRDDRGDRTRDTPAPSTATERTETPTLHFALGPRTTADVGSLPKASLGAGAGLALWQGRWTMTASAQAWLPRQASTNLAGVGGEIGLWTGELRGCTAVLQFGGHADVCLGAEAGAMDGVAVGLARPGRARGLWIAGLAGFAVRPTTSGLFGAWIGLDVGVPLTVPTYVIVGLGEVHRPWPVFARASMGMEFRVF